MHGRLLQMVLASGLAVAFTGAWAQSANGIYTCIDAKGKRWTSDRYIQECTDREQKVMNPTGTVRAIVPPSLTAREREAQDQVDKKAAEEAQRRGEEKRVQRALLSRYPNKASHDVDRAKALRSLEDSAQAAQHNIAELRRQRAGLATETEFYKDPAKMPGKLRRQIEENESSVAAQQRFVANQEEEKKRVNARFDEELAQLKKLWVPASVAEAEVPKR
ncbi:MAG: hypothetical protein JWQ76_2995 [Ramlibacter sp.]|nr:hypothetical protein [Ramlibacter sp.]